jgi:hypothetical protein
MKIGLSLLLLLLAATWVLSQAPQAAPPAPSLERLQTVASEAPAVIGRLHVEKWKANSEARSAARADADSLQRNLTSALPGLIEAARSSPEDVNAQFKLYRNLNALYDVFGTLTEATRVFGQRSDYEALSQQLQVIGVTRRKLGETLEELTASTQNQLKQMRVQIKTQQEQLTAAQAAVAEARREVELAQAEPPKKPAPKKKAVAKKPAAASSSSNANSPSPSSNGQAATGTPSPKS